MIYAEAPVYNLPVDFISRPSNRDRDDAEITGSSARLAKFETADRGPIAPAPGARFPLGNGAGPPGFLSPARKTNLPVGKRNPRRRRRRRRRKRFIRRLARFLIASAHLRSAGTADDADASEATSASPFRASHARLTARPENFPGGERKRNESRPTLGRHLKTHSLVSLLGSGAESRPARRWTPLKDAGRSGRLNVTIISHSDPY